MTKYFTILLISILFLTACGQRTSENINLDDIEVAKVQISAETMRDIIQDVASPMEVSTLINSLQIPYSASNLPKLENLSTEIDPLEQAFRLGMFYTDLGYLHIYEKTDPAENFLENIDQLTTALRIDQYFDIATIRRLATSSSMDSLLFISVNSFNHMGNYLRESDRGDESALMICGAWLEGLYLSTQATLRKDSEHLHNLIGDQKMILNDLLLVLNYFNGESLMKDYIADLEKIMTVYDEVEIISVVEDPEAVEKDGMVELVQSETSVLKMSDEVLGKITETTAQVRNAHLNSASVSDADLSQANVSSTDLAKTIMSSPDVRSAQVAMKTQAK